MRLMELIYYRTAFGSRRKWPRDQWWVFSKSKEELRLIKGEKPRERGPDAGNELPAGEF